MIPERSGIAVDSTVTGEDVRMVIDESALAHIMGVLTDLYADSELAVIREYSTNALDSHAEAGQKRPIEVTTPSDLRPLFSVRDYGVGLSAEDIRAIYSRYGVSTKRASNDAVGMLGLGCKSALAYVDQFTLTGVKDGQKVVVSVSRAEDGSGGMTIISDEATDAPSGVEVSVPVHRGNAFARKAADFFRVWAPGTVLVDGKEPPALDGVALTPELTVVDREGSWKDRGPRLLIVMGNVAYPADDLVSVDELSLPVTKGLVARVPIGSVQFAPSREALQDTGRTRETLTKIKGDFKAAAEGHARRHVEKCKTRGEAVRAVADAVDALGMKWPDLKFKGELIPSALTVEAEWNRGSHYYRGVSSPMNRVTMAAATGAVWVLGWDNAKWSAPQRRKLDAYVAHHDLMPNNDRYDAYLLKGDELPGEKWLDGGVVKVDWPTIRKWRDPDATKAGASTSGRRYAGTYPAIGWAPSGTHNPDYIRDVDATELAKVPDANLYYVEATKYQQSPYKRLRVMDPKAVLAKVPSTRLAKFQRLFPAATLAETALNGAAGRWWDGLKPDQQQAVRAFGVYHAPPILRELRSSASELNDPALRAMIELSAIYTDDLANGWSSYKDDLDGKVKPAAKRPETVLKPYPLLPQDRYSIQRRGSIEHGHYILYVNAVYAANQEESA